MFRFTSLIALGFLTCLTGCSTKAMMDRVAPETVKEAKTNFDYLRTGQYDRIEPSLDPRIDRSSLRANLTAMAALVPTQAPVSVETVGAYVECDTRKGCDTRVTLQYQFPAKWVLVQMLVHRENGRSTITSFDVSPKSESLEATNRFTLKGKSPRQYEILGAAICSLAVMIVALVLCIRTPMEKRKWLWIILILLGAGKLGVDWTTGETFYHILWISILPGGIGAELYGSWKVSVSLPLGAALFLILRTRLRRIESPAQSENAVPSSTASVG